MNNDNIFFGTFIIMTIKKYETFPFVSFHKKNYFLLNIQEKIKIICNIFNTRNDNTLQDISQKIIFYDIIIVKHLT